jgi:hypothetical protein
MELVDGYQIEDSIAQKYDLKPGTISPFTRLSVETLSPEKVRKAEEAGRLKKIKRQKEALGKEKQKLESNFARKKENLSVVDSKISGYVADIKATTKSINHSDESHDFARRRARSGRGPVMRNRIFKREETRMANVKKVVKKAVKKTPAKPVKAAAKAAAKPTKAKAKAKAKAPTKAKAVAKKPAAKKPAKAKK